MTTPQLCLLTIGISSCLAGETVRYDGKHKHYPVIHSLFRHFAALTPICPEVGAGLSTPRAAIELININNQLFAKGRDNNSLDVSQVLYDYVSIKMPSLACLDGYLLKSKSPSCGINDTPIKKEKYIYSGSGIFAEAITTTYPHLPLIDENVLTKLPQLISFVGKMYAYQAWKQLQVSAKNNKQQAFNLLIHFHQTYRSQLILRSENETLQLESYINNSKDQQINQREYYKQYGQSFFSLLQQPLNNNSNLFSYSQQEQDLLKQITESFS